MYGDKKKEISGGEAMTTNNRMELMGVITGLTVLKEPCRVTLYTDSSYVVNAVNQGWLYGWKKKNWKKKGGDVKNPDLWQRVLELIGRHDVTFVWVKGHAENEYNNRCDELAVMERQKFAG